MKKDEPGTERIEQTSRGRKWMGSSCWLMKNSAGLSSCSTWWGFGLWSLHKVRDYEVRSKRSERGKKRPTSAFLWGINEVQQGFQLFNEPQTFSPLLPQRNQRGNYFVSFTNMAMPPKISKCTEMCDGSASSLHCHLSSCWNPMFCYF